MSRKNRPPPQLTRLPPHLQARSKGTATNLPEKEFLPFFSMFLNEALTLPCFHRPAKIHQWRGGGVCVCVRARGGQGYAGMTAFVPELCAPSWPQNSEGLSCNVSKFNEMLSRSLNTNTRVQIYKCASARNISPGPDPSKR